jgi:hypothetical protein
VVAALSSAWAAAPSAAVDDPSDPFPPPQAASASAAALMPMISLIRMGFSLVHGLLSSLDHQPTGH